MEKISTVDEFIEQAGFFRHDGSVVGPEDDFEFEDVVFEPDHAQFFVSKNPEVQAWTMVSGDNGDYLTSGLHYVNRLGYMFTIIIADDPRLAEHSVGDCLSITWYEEVANG